MVKRRVVLAVLLALGSLTACNVGASASDGKPTVVAAFYPLAYLAERIGGDAVHVSNLAKPGAEPHDLELSIPQSAEIGAADLVVYLHGFQPAVDQAVVDHRPEHVFDVATVERLADAAETEHAHSGDKVEAGGGKDPHIWLDPVRLAAVADRLAARLGEIDSAHAADFTARGRAVRSDLESLDREYAARLATCQRREIVTSHAAFGYLAARYHLEQVGITGIGPETEPSLQRLTEVAAEAKAHGATTIFFETLVSPTVAQAIADRVGAQTAVLDPVEGLQPGATGDYFTVMRADLGALTTALGCS